MTIANPGDAQKTIHLRYRVKGTEAWSDPALTANTYSASASIDLAGLTPDTDYEVEASLDSAFGESCVSDLYHAALPQPVSR